MNLQNGYKVIYEKAVDGKRTFYASKSGLFKDAEAIAEVTISEYKLIYEKDGKFYGSTSGIPAENDYCFEEFRAVFEEGYTNTDSAAKDETPEDETPEDKTPEDETPEEDPENEPENEVPEDETESETEPEDEE